MIEPFPSLTSALPKGLKCAADYEFAAAHCLPAATLAYLAGGSGEDITVELNRRAFAQLRLVTRVLPKLNDPTTEVTLFGRRHPMPVLLAPVAYHGLVHAGGEVDTARGAAAFGCCMVASTLSTCSLEEIAIATPQPKWFQLYFRDTHEATLELIRRAEAVGFEALVVTLDAACQLPSRRAVDAGFCLPSSCLPQHLPGTARNLVSEQGGVLRQIGQVAVSREDLRWLKSVTHLPVLAKGVLHPDDARQLRELGVDGIVVSNHGGRTLDGVCASLAALPAVRAAVGASILVLFDGGIRCGLDILKALARGADAVFIGRLQLYALAAAGALGVGHLLKLLMEELQVAMAMAGCRDLDAARHAAFWPDPEFAGAASLSFTPTAHR